MKKILIAVLVAAVGGVMVIAGPRLFAAEGVAKKTEKPAAASDAPKTPWTVRCNDKIKDEGTKRGRCEIFQSLIVKESKQRFVEMAISYPKDKTKARGVVVMPLGVLLQAGAQIKIDDGKPLKFHARYCDPSGCFGFLDLDEPLLDSMRKGTKIVLSFVAINTKTINVEMSLKDFAGALKEIS